VQPSPAAHAGVHAALQFFLRAGAARPPPLAAAPAALPRLSVPDQTRVRDRSTILSRQLFSDAGDAVADAHAARLMHTLGIDPAQLPDRVHPHHSAWGQVWQEQAAHRAHAARAHPVPGDSWANEFASGHSTPGPLVDSWEREFQQALVQSVAVQGPRPVYGGPPAATAAAPQSVAWAEEFSGVRSSAEGTKWAQDFGSSEGDQWAQEFAAQPDNATTTASGADAAAEQSRRLLGVLSNEPDPKFKRSQFVQFLSKMSRGEVNFKSDAVAAAAPAAAWAGDFATQQQQQGGVAAWAGEFDALQNGNGAVAWSEEFVGQSAAARGAGAVGDASADAWASEFYSQQVTFPPVRPRSVSVFGACSLFCQQHIFVHVRWPHLSGRMTVSQQRVPVSTGAARGARCGVGRRRRRDHSAASASRRRLRLCREQPA
jgi:hypothetical protein